MENEQIFLNKDIDNIRKNNEKINLNNKNIYKFIFF